MRLIMFLDRSIKYQMTIFEDFHYFFNLEALFKPFAITFKIISSPFHAIGYLAKSFWQNLNKQPDAPRAKEIFSNLGQIFSEGFIEAFSTPEASSSTCAEVASTGCCPQGHQHANGTGSLHEHSALPDQILELVFSPLFVLAALWHWAFQDPNRAQQESFTECFFIF